MLLLKLFSFEFIKIKFCGVIISFFVIIYERLYFGQIPTASNTYECFEAVRVAWYYYHDKMTNDRISLEEFAGIDILFKLEAMEFL